MTEVSRGIGSCIHCELPENLVFTYTLKVRTPVTHHKENIEFFKDPPNSSETHCSETQPLINRHNKEMRVSFYGFRSLFSISKVLKIPLES